MLDVGERRGRLHPAITAAASARILADRLASAANAVDARECGWCRGEIGVDRAAKERLARESPIVQQSRERRHRRFDRPIVVDRARGLGHDPLVGIVRGNARRRDGASAAARRWRRFAPRATPAGERGDLRGVADPRQREASGLTQVDVPSSFPASIKTRAGTAGRYASRPSACAAKNRTRGDPSAR